MNIEFTQENIKTYFSLIDDKHVFLIKAYNRNRKLKQLTISRNGEYLGMYIFGKQILFHRFIFLWHHGWLPEYIDHIDLNKYNCSIDNLRPASVSQNAINRKKRAGLTSKFKGVSLVKKTGRWLATIEKTINGKRKSKGLGTFINERSAALKYIQIAKIIHDNDFLNLKSA